MDELKNNSYKLRDFISKDPNKLINHGSTVIVISFAALLLLCSFISYNDIIVSEVIITSENPPIKIKSRINGELQDVFISHGQKIKANQILAEIKNPALYSDIVLVDSKINSLNNLSNLQLDSLSVVYPNNLQLGSIQESYNAFFANYQTFILHDSLKPLQNQNFLLSQQINQEKNLLQSRRLELVHFRNELTLSQKSFDRSKQLFNKGVISKTDFENASRTRLSDYQTYENIKSKVNQSQIEISKLEQDSTMKQVSELLGLGENKAFLKQSIQELKINIQLHEQQYLLKSPIDGTVNMFDRYHKFQNVVPGETLFTIFPNNTKSIIGTLKIPILNSGKVQPNQKVIVKLKNYPHYQYGTLTGRVTGISGAPNQDNSTYSVFIKLDSKTTNYGHTLKFDHEFLGTAEIITEELSLFQRIFYATRKVFSRDPKPTILE